MANRRVLVQAIAEDGSSVVTDLHSGAVVTASSTDYHHEFLQGIFRETSFVGDALQVPLPQDFYLPSGWALNITIENGVAGDSYEANFVVEVTYG